METFKSNEQIKSYFENAYAFAVFPHCAKAGFAVGAAGGSGDVYINNKDGTETKVGTSLMRQVSVGFQLGGQIYSEILFFETETDFERFKDGNFEFGAEASAVALTASASAKVTTMGNQGVTSGITAGKAHLDNAGGYAKGSAVFTVALGGIMYQATIAGQKFSFKPVDA